MKASDFIEKYRFYIGIFLIFVILAGTVVLLWQRKNQVITGINDKDKITIDIEGAVVKPGVYEFEKGAIIEDAIKKAGGTTDKSDIKRLAEEINRAEKLEDGQKIMIPIKEEIAINNTRQIESEDQEKDTEQVSGTKVEDKININTATLDVLDTLPGIGPAYAQRIIDYRNQNGDFETIEEVMEVEGIGEKTFEKIQNKITI